MSLYGQPLDYKQIKEKSIFALGINKKLFLSYIPSQDDISLIREEQNIKLNRLNNFYCDNCHVLVKDDHNYGSWHCRYHWGSFNKYNKSWSCCGATVMAYDIWGGCRRCDHRELRDPIWHRAARYIIPVLGYYSRELYKYTLYEAINEIYTEGDLQIRNGPKDFNMMEYTDENHDTYLLDLGNIFFVIDRVQRTEQDNIDLNIID